MAHREAIDVIFYHERPTRADAQQRGSVNQEPNPSTSDSSETLHAKLQALKTHVHLR